MAIFDFKEGDVIGTVFSVDTATLIVKVEEIDKLRKLQYMFRGINDFFKNKMGELDDKK